MRLFRPFTAASLLVLFLGIGAFLVLRPAPAGVSGSPQATLVVLTGSVQLRRAGSAAATVARGGDQLRSGDRLTTGPGTRAVLELASGDQARLDGGATLEVGASARADLHLESGQVWNRLLASRSDPYVVTAAGHRLVGRLPATVFSVTVGPGGAAAEVLAGEVISGNSIAGGGTFLSLPGTGPSRVASLTETQKDEPWTVINRVLDLAPGRPGPAALGTGDLLPGEETSPQQAVTVPPAPRLNLVFTAGWQTGDLELVVLDPDGAIFEQTSGPPPVTLTIPAARFGGWGFRLRRTDSGSSSGSAASAWFVAVSLVPQ